MRRPPMCHRRAIRDAPRARRIAGRWLVPDPVRQHIEQHGLYDAAPTRDDGRRRHVHGRARQAGCMAKTERRRTTAALPKPIELAVAAAEDKKAMDIVVLDLRKGGRVHRLFRDLLGHQRAPDARHRRRRSSRRWPATAQAGARRRLRPIRVDPASTTSISSCTSSRPRRGCSTASSGCGAMPSGSRFRLTT